MADTAASSFHCFVIAHFTFYDLSDESNGNGDSYIYFLEMSDQAASVTVAADSNHLNTPLISPLPHLVAVFKLQQMHDISESCSVNNSDLTIGQQWRCAETLL